MKLCKTSFLFFLLFSFSAFADSNLKIFNWSEDSNLTSAGKKTEILIQARAENLPKDQVLAGFSIGFGEKRKIKINQVICDSSLANYSFQNNVLNIKFSTPKSEKDSVRIYFSYEEIYEEVNQYLRQETINIPPFAVGADAMVTLRFTRDLESATLNPNVVKNGNSFVYRNKVPREGVSEIIKLTPRQIIWDVVLKTAVSTNKPLKNVLVTLPIYFQNGGQKFEDKGLATSISPIKREFKNGANLLTFNINVSEVVIENRATIYAGKNDWTAINRNFQDYLKIDEKDAALLAPILTKIKKDPDYSAFPLHAKIGKFVHNFIKYDINYVGRLPSVREILQNPNGVCTEYANLYNSLARLAGIPSVIVDGGACGDKKCEGHSWNMIFRNGKWIHVDPTWDLMSGIVSSSHVYFNDQRKSDVEVKYFSNPLDNDMKVDTKLDFEMRERE